MVFTTLTLLGWAIAFALLGAVIGWMLRGVRSRSELAVERARILDDDGIERMRMRLASLEDVRIERDRLRTEVDTVKRTASEAADTVAEAMLFGSASTDSGRIDDLTLIKGIGPKIAELCHAHDIRTWSEMASADVDDLKSMLESSGSRYQFHDPTNWPEQAGLLSQGRWDEFTALLQRLDQRSGAQRSTS